MTFTCTWRSLELDKLVNAGFDGVEVIEVTRRARNTRSTSARQAGLRVRTDEAAGALGAEFLPDQSGQLLIMVTVADDDSPPAGLDYTGLTVEHMSAVLEGAQSIPEIADLGAGVLSFDRAEVYPGWSTSEMFEWLAGAVVRLLLASAARLDDEALAGLLQVAYDPPPPPEILPEELPVPQPAEAESAEAPKPVLAWDETAPEAEAEPVDAKTVEFMAAVTFEDEPQPEAVPTTAAEAEPVDAETAEFVAAVTFENEPQPEAAPSTAAEAEPVYAETAEFMAAVTFEPQAQPELEIELQAEEVEPVFTDEHLAEFLATYAAEPETLVEPAAWAEPAPQPVTDDELLDAEIAEFLNAVTFRTQPAARPQAEPEPQPAISIDQELEAFLAAVEAARAEARARAELESRAAPEPEPIAGPVADFLSAVDSAEPEEPFELVEEAIPAAGPQEPARTPSEAAVQWVDIDAAPVAELDGVELSPDETAELDQLAQAEQRMLAEAEKDREAEADRLAIARRLAGLDAFDSEEMNARQAAPGSSQPRSEPEPYGPEVVLIWTPEPEAEPAADVTLDAEELAREGLQAAAIWPGAELTREEAAQLSWEPEAEEPPHAEPEALAEPQAAQAWPGALDETAEITDEVSIQPSSEPEDDLLSARERRIRQLEKLAAMELARKASTAEGTIDLSPDQIIDPGLLRAPEGGPPLEAEAATGSVDQAEVAAPFGDLTLPEPPDWLSFEPPPRPTDTGHLRDTAAEAEAAGTVDTEPITPAEKSALRDALLGRSRPADRFSLRLAEPAPAVAPPEPPAEHDASAEAVTLIYTFGEETSPEAVEAHEPAGDAAELFATQPAFALDEAPEPAAPPDFAEVEGEVQPAASDAGEVIPTSPPDAVASPGATARPDIEHVRYEYPPPVKTKQRGAGRLEFYMCAACGRYSAYQIDPEHFHCYLCGAVVEYRLDTATVHPHEDEAGPPS